MFSTLASVAEVEERWRLRVVASANQGGRKHTKLGGGGMWLVQRIHGFTGVSRVGGCTAVGKWQELELEQVGSHEDRLISLDFTLEILEVVPVIYCCVTKHPKFSGLEQ